MSLASGVLWGPPLPVAADPAHPELGEPIPLRCRDQQGAWRACAMEVLEVGKRWNLILEDTRFEFSHDGRGSVTMRRHPPEPGTTPDWVPVDVRWSDDPALCWDGVCAQGDIPLD